MNQIIKAGALVCALAMLEWNPAAVAEEKRLGDYIYVPAMSNPAGMGAISLRVEGVKSGENGEKETVEALAGAEFGVYVYSSEGKLTPWANPLPAQRADAHPHGRNRNALQPAAGHGVLPEAGTRAGGLHVRQPDADPGDGRRNRRSEQGAGAAEHHGARPAGRGDRRRSPDGDGRDGRANGIDDRWKRTSGAALRPRGKLHRFGNRAAGGRSSGAKRQRERAGGACIRRERRL